jgi:polysaccharide deacetylase 2 family uncharacterized protein YibQ
VADTDGQHSRRDRRGWRRLAAFWAVVVSLMAVAAGAVQYQGAPSLLDSERKSPDPASREAGGTAILSPSMHAAEQTGRGAVIAAAQLVAGRDIPGPVADPDPAMQESLSGGSKENLPRIASDGRTAIRVYAAGFDYGSRRPRIGLLLAGIGMNETESDAAIRALPGAVSLGVSPYAATNAPGNGSDANGPGASGAALTRLLATARATGHEYLIAIPLEPAGFPLNDPGPYTLLTGASAFVNARNLDWALSRAGGYVGATGVIGTMRGERLAAMTDQMDAVLSTLAQRGLLYVDPRETLGPVAKASVSGTVISGIPVSRTWGRHVDFVIDDPSDQGVADRGMIDAKLVALEQQARDTGSALGLVMRPTPIAVARIAAWSNGLAGRGLTMAPVSALVMPPAETVAVKLSERE